MFYRLVIQNNPDGTLSGAAAYDTPTSDARPITVADLEGFMPDVNAAALGQKEAQSAAHAAAIAARDAQLAYQATEANLARQAATEAHAAALAAKDAEKDAAVEAEGRAVHARLDALVQAGQEAHAAGDLVALGAVLDAAYGYTSAARFARLENELVAAQAAVTAAVDKLAALHG
jgi:hypothetical protein